MNRTRSVMSFNLLKSELRKTITLSSDAYKMGQMAKEKGYSSHFNPFCSVEDLQHHECWLLGWKSVS